MSYQPLTIEAITTIDLAIAGVWAANSAGGEMSLQSLTEDVPGVFGHFRNALIASLLIHYSVPLADMFWDHLMATNEVPQWYAYDCKVTTKSNIEDENAA